MSNDESVGLSRLDEIMRARRRRTLRRVVLVTALAAIAAFFVWQRGELGAPLAEQLPQSSAIPTPEPSVVALSPRPSPTAAVEVQLASRERAAFPDPTRAPDPPPPSQSEKTLSANKVALPALEASDPLVRRQVGALASDLAIERWLAGPGLIRRFVVSVVNVSEGNSPRKQLNGLAPDGKFKIRLGRHAYTEPSTYARYDVAAQAFAAVDAETAAKLIDLLDPLLDQAYGDLGYPVGGFRDALAEAIVELLGAPVVKGDPALVLDVITYVYLDEELESLSQAQKQLLRMGPESVVLIHSKLRQLAIALEIPEEDLPELSVHRVRSPSRTALAQ